MLANSFSHNIPLLRKAQLNKFRFYGSLIWWSWSDFNILMQANVEIYIYLWNRVLQ